MSKIIKKRFDASDEQQSIPKGKIDVVRLNDLKVIRATLEPGWRWSESLKPMAKTDSCQIHHLLYFISGRMSIRLDGGSTTEFGPGDIADIPAGHDGWIVGDVPCVYLDLGSAVFGKSSG